MKPALVLIAAITVAAVAPAVGAQDAQDGNTLVITAHDGENNEYWFEVEGLEGQNPTITLNAGEEYTVEFTNEGQGVHNVHFLPPIEARTEVLPSGESETLTFTVPANATEESAYVCDPHEIFGMRGTVTFQGGEATDGTDGTDDTDGTDGTDTTDGTDGTADEEESIPSVGVIAALAVVGLAAAAGRRRR